LISLHAARYLSKGRWVFVDGRLETQRWHDGDELVAVQVRATRWCSSAPGRRVAAIGDW
jgi:single-stranded DNA-binding protein